MTTQPKNSNHLTTETLIHEQPLLDTVQTNDLINLVETGNESLLSNHDSFDDSLVHTGRKPYIHTQPKDWYKHNRFFKRYMLRELTAIPVVLESLNLFWGLVSLAGTAEQWQHWVSVQSNFLMIIFHLFVIVAALFNSYTWFGAMPKAMRIQTGEKFVADKILIGGSWVTLVIILIVLASIVKYFA